MSLVIKVLWKLISLIYFRVYLEVNVHKNPTALAVGVSVSYKMDSLGFYGAYGTNKMHEIQVYIK